MAILPNTSRVELTILSALRSKDRYGLEIIETVNNISGGRQQLSLGGLYTTLHRMERKGLVSGRWGETSEVRQGARRRYYSITGLGERALREIEACLSKGRLATAGAR